MKAEINNLHVIFLLKKNIQADIIKMILGYLLIAVLEILKERKMAIISVRQEYKSIELIRLSNRNRNDIQRKKCTHGY